MACPRKRSHSQGPSNHSLKKARRVPPPDTARIVVIRGLPDKETSPALSAWLVHRLENRHDISPNIVKCWIQNQPKCAFVEFQTTSEVAAALKMNNYDYKRAGRITIDIHLQSSLNPRVELYSFPQDTQLSEDDKLCKETLQRAAQFRLQDDLPSIALGTPRLENQQLKERVESNAYLQTELALVLQQQSQKYYKQQRIESKAQIRVQKNDLAAQEWNRLRLENEQPKEKAQSDRRRRHAELTRVLQEVQEVLQPPQSEETPQVKQDDAISALRHENQQLKRKHYIDASDKLELVDLRRKEEQFQLERAAKSQEMNRMKRSLDLLEQESAELRSKLREETRKESNVELEDSKREANSLRDEIDQIRAEANAFRDENRQSELESAKKTIQSLETQIKGMRSYFQAAATVFEAPRDDKGIQRRQQEQPNDDGATTIVKTNCAKATNPKVPSQGLAEEPKEGK